MFQAKKKISLLLRVKIEDFVVKTQKLQLKL